MLNGPPPPPRTITPTDLTFRGYQTAPDEAKPTARGLWLTADPSGVARLDPARLAAALYPADDPASARDLIELHVLMLEESGFLWTWAEAGAEWLVLRHPLAPATRGTTRDDSTASKRARERAHEQARAQAREERERSEQAWEASRMAGRGAPERPSRPAVLDAPPMGCPDHPNGWYLPCGPCGTAAEFRRKYLAERKYEDQLAEWEFWHGTDEETAPDDEPF